HRAHASTYGVAEKLPAAAGFLLENEVTILSKALTEPERPFTSIIGGAKVKDKIEVIENLLDKVDHLLIGGGLANTFIKAAGHEIGKSLVEEDKLELAKSFMDKAKEKEVEFLIPEDVVIANKFSSDANTKIVDVDQVPADWMILDIGPKTRDTYSNVIVES